MEAFIQELLKTGLYKRSQGRVTRQVTFAALALTFALGYYRLHQALFDTASSAAFGLAYWLPGVLLLLCWWISYRLVNMPSFADFLIAVEAELNKVSWPTKGELIRASIVVLVCIIALAVLLFVFDIIWREIFVFLRILK